MAEMGTNQIKLRKSSFTESETFTFVPLGGLSR